MHASVCDMVLDLAQNAIEADASQIVVMVRTQSDWLEVLIEDNGKGMDEQVLQRVLDPFYTDGKKHKHRRVGMGLPFLKQLVDCTEGKMHMASTVGQGTTLRFQLNLEKVDVPPLGDVAATVLSVMNFPGDYELKFSRHVGEQGYEVGRHELLEVLSGMETVGDLQLAKQYLSGLEEDLV